MTPREQEEYSALRATIRERGTARVWVFAVGLFVWAALLAGLLAAALPPVATLAPLVALAAAFEGVFALHVGVERIGRYLFVFHEDQWERVAGEFGRAGGILTTDPLFAAVFVIAAVVDVLPLLTTTPIAQEWILFGAAHGGFVLRVLVARAAAARQRREDAARFEQVRARADTGLTEGTGMEGSQSARRS